MILILFCIVFSVSILLSRKIDRFFIIVFSVSVAYFCILGYWYWTAIRNFEFLGVYWFDMLPRAREILVIYSMVVIFSAACFSRLSPTKHIESHHLFPTTTFNAIVSLGVAGALYVLYGSISYGGLNPDDTLALLIGQFADVLTPCLIFSIAWRGWTKSNAIAVMLFVSFAVFVGFRTRIVLVCGPLLYLFWADSNFGRGTARRKLLVIASGIFILLLFSVMTFSREKFNAFNFDQISNANFTDMLDGFFGESNIIFGLIGVLTEFVDVGFFIWLQPILDSFIEFIPRYFYPEKSTGDYLVIAVRGLLASNAVESGTAYPFVGEFLIMGGHPFALVLSIFIGFIVVHFRKVIENSTSNESLLNAGIGIISVFFGYYYYSRGYIPQMFKLFIFSVLPYYVLLKQSRISSVKNYNIRDY